MPVPSPSRRAGSFRGEGLAASAPIAAIAVMVGLIGLFLWIVSQDRREDQQVKLVRDTLWIEQTLRFQIGSHQDNLLRLAAELGVDSLPAAPVMARARHMVANNAEMLRIAWRDTGGKTLGLAPAGAQPGISQAQADALGRANRGHPAWSEPQPRDGDYLSTLVVPVFDAANRVTGTLEAEISLGSLLAAHVPWWIAEHYQVTLARLDGTVLARKSNAVVEGHAAHTMSFDPPLHGVFLSLAPYREESGLLEHTLVATIVGLALLAIVNLWMQHRHARRRLLAEHALRREQAFRKAMEDSSTVGQRARDLESRLLYVNPAFCRMVGWERDELIGQGPPLPYWERDLVSETMERHHRNRQSPRAHSFETVFRRRDGSPIDVMVYEAPLIDADGRHIGWMASIIDISERKRAEAQASQQADKLQQTGRLITMGEMASTLAHELNQPLAAVASYAAGCLNLLRHDDPDRGRLAAIMENLAAQNRRAGQIIRRVHDFVRKREPQLDTCDLSRIVRETVDFCLADARKSGARIVVRRAPAGLTVRADRVLIEQVLVNLIRNAIEAMAACEPGMRCATVDVDLDGGRVIVSVSDNGPGIEPEMIERIFMPFVTTKASGMGMGLNICRSIMELHKGNLWFEAGQERGAVFLFSLALARPAGEAAAEAEGEPGLARIDG